jgi:hypothetical protein
LKKNRKFVLQGWADTPSKLPNFGIAIDAMQVDATNSSIFKADLHQLRESRAGSGLLRRQIHGMTSIGRPQKTIHFKRCKSVSVTITQVRLTHYSVSVMMTVARSGGGVESKRLPHWQSILAWGE